MVVNLFLSVAQFNVENFPWPISQSVAQLQFSYMLRSINHLQKKRSLHWGTQFFAYFQAISKKEQKEVKGFRARHRIFATISGKKQVIALIQLFKPYIQFPKKLRGPS